MIETGTSLIFELISDIFKRGNRKIKILFILALVFMVLAFTSQTLGEVNIIIFGFAKIISIRKLKPITTTNPIINASNFLMP